MIERLPLPASAADLDALAALLVDAVDSGAAVSFVTLTRAQALDWWRKLLSAPPSRATVLVARDAEGIAGSVQLHPASAPNQPHRADVAKLIVHRRARGRGLGAALMAAVEREAASAGFRLLVLDSKLGDAGERTGAGRLQREAGPRSERDAIAAHDIDQQGNGDDGEVTQDDLSAEVDDSQVEWIAVALRLRAAGRVRGRHADG